MRFIFKLILQQASQVPVAEESVTQKNAEPADGEVERGIDRAPPCGALADPHQHVAGGLAISAFYKVAS